MTLRPPGRKSPGDVLGNLLGNVILVLLALAVLFGLFILVVWLFGILVAML